MKYIQGKNNYSADTLSRIYFFNQKQLVMQVKDIKKLQQTNSSTTKYKQLRKIKTHSSGLWIDSRERVLIPTEVTTEFLKDLHLKLIHPGETKLYNTVKRFLFIPQCKKIIKQITHECILCCRCNDRRIKYGNVSGNIHSNEVL
ncbi:hypothetical protein DMUE_5968 [Dictyocoela muelleri]|nr:hypothetical protein DMUE_5968 [Dictyocoela muelleri]